MKRVLILVLVGYWAYGYIQDNPNLLSSLLEGSFQSSVQDGSGAQDAFRNKLSDVQVSGSGVVSRVLSDDNLGSRHQRFILRVSSGQSVLIAHNIDLAPRINGLSKFDNVQFYGEYEWNSKGGVIHWTHRDPAGRHVAGWLKHNGKKYQ